jgi:hypothetical protein
MISTSTPVAKAVASRKRPPKKPKAPAVYELWIGCEDFDLKPERVYTTTSLDDVMTWKKAVERYEKYDYELTVRMNGKAFEVPPAEPWQFATPEEARAAWEKCQSDDFLIYELVSSSGGICERHVSLSYVIKEMLHIWVNTNPMGGYTVRKRQATVAAKPKPSLLTYAVWFVDAKTGKWIEECDSGLTLEEAREQVVENDEVNAWSRKMAAADPAFPFDFQYDMKILRVEEYVVEEGGAS